MNNYSMSNEEFVEEILFEADKHGKLKEVRERAEELVKLGNRRSLSYAQSYSEIVNENDTDRSVQIPE